MKSARDQSVPPQGESDAAPTEVGDPGPDSGATGTATAQSFFDADASGIGSELVATLLAHAPTHPVLATADLLAGDAYDGDVALAAADSSSALADLGHTLDALTTSADLFDVPAIDTGLSDDVMPT